MSRCVALVLFSLLLLPLLWWGQRHTPPLPFYDQLRQDEAAPLIPLHAHADFVFEFEAPAAHIRGIWLEHLFTDPKADVLIQVENRTRTILLLREHVGQGHQHWARIPPTNQRGDRIMVTYRMVRSRQDQFPAIVQAVKRSATAPRYPIQIHSRGAAPPGAELFPLFQLRYDHPFRMLLLLWPVLLVAGFFLHRRDAPQSERLVFLIILALAGSATSYLAWTQAYEAVPAIRDPERQLAYAEALNQWMGAPDASTRAKVAEGFGEFPWVHCPLVPFLAALPARLGFPVNVCFFWITGIAGFGTLLLLDFYLVAAFQIRPRATLLILLLFGCHLVLTQGFLDPASRGALTGIALALCTALSLRAHHAFTWHGELLFGLGLFALALSHPAGPACALCFAVMATLLDLVRTRRLDLNALGRSLEYYLVPPAVAYALLALAFDWWRSMAGLRDAAQSSQHLSTWSQWLPPFLIASQAHLVVSSGFRFRDARRLSFLIPAAFTAFFLIQSALSLESFRLRSFLPVLPAIHLLAGPALQRLDADRPRAALAAAFSLAVANLWAMILVLGRLPSRESSLISLFTW